MHALTGIDHPVLAVRDLAAARAAWTRLGFIVPPRGRHLTWGTGNWCIQFARDYLELRGLLFATDAPANRELQRHLATREGLSGVAFGTLGVQVTHDSFVVSGLHPEPVKPLTREFELPEGSSPVSFRLCFLPRETTPGLGHVVVCEHMTPELLRRPEWLQHPNGARGVAGLISVAADPEAHRAAWAKIFGRVETVPGGLYAALGDQWLLLLSPDIFAARYGGLETPTAEGPAAVVLKSAAPAATRVYFAERGLLAPLPDRIVLPPAAAGGAVLEFL